MADSDYLSKSQHHKNRKKMKTKTKKRKQRSINEEEGEVRNRPSKSYRRDEQISEVEEESRFNELQDESPWRNLQFFSSIENKSVPLPELVRQLRDRTSKSHQRDEQIREVEEEARVNELQDESPWRNLQLVLSIENTTIPLSENLELAYNFVKSRTKGAGEKGREEIQAVSFSRMIGSLSDWVQRALTSSVQKKKKIHLDYRYWVIFKFCLEESKKMGVSLLLFRDLLKVVQSVSGDALNHLANDERAKGDTLNVHADDESTVSEESDLHCIMLSCISLVFSSHGGVSKENLDLWISLVSTVLEVVWEVLHNKLDDTKVGIFAVQLSCYLLEPFAKFLKVHPANKKYFGKFIDKLFEDLMVLWDALDVNNACESKRNLIVLIEEVLSQALFHPTNMDGFLTLQSTSKYKCSDDMKSKEEIFFMKSYHRHLFVKLAKIITEKNASAICGAGGLLRLFIRCIYQKSGGLLGTDARKSVFDFFVEIMELFLPEISTKIGSGPLYSEVHSTLRAINKLLATFVHEKVYVRTEDTSEGACFNFLKLIYDAIVLLTAEIYDSEEQIPGKLLILAAKEIFMVMQYLLDIEYKVVGDDLEKLWGTILALTNRCNSSMSVSDQCLLNKVVLKLGCRVVHLYSELRQVNIAIFALCKAIREMVLLSTFPRHSFVRLSTVLCSPEFTLSIINAVKSIPEGQASGCIRQLILDITESLEWIKSKHQSPAGTDLLGLKAELLGKTLSEVYTLILDSMTVTTGNSNLLARSVKDLMSAIRPSMSSLVSQEPDILNVFFPLVTGKESPLESDFLSVCWILVFLFRLYMSCRSLQRQAISLMPPDASKKMSKEMADSFMAISAKEWLERTDWEDDESYFSWMIQPSAPLVSVMHSITKFCYPNTLIGCSPLIYVLSGMALQRLVDLNRQMKSIDYLLLRNNDAKNTKKWKKRLSTLKEEAVGLTAFFLSNGTYFSHLDETEKWDHCTSSVNETLLPSALWWIICQNVDIWCPHASKKDLKKFLLALIQNSWLPGSSTNMSELTNHIEASCDVIGVDQRLVSAELLRNTILYEQRPICRHIASRFCQIFKESASSIFLHVGEVDLKSPPDWENAINMLEMSPVNLFRREPIHHLRQDKELSPTFNTETSRCRTFLNLLSWLPKGCLSSKSFSLCATSILNIDRLVVRCLFDQHSSFNLSDRYELLRLLVTCRKTFKNLIMASEENKGRKFLESSTVIWLQKSLFTITGAFSRGTSQMKHMIFSLMDHTSFILTSVIKHQLKEDDLSLNFSETGVTWGSVLFVADALIEHSRNLLDSLKRNVGDLSEELEKVTPVVSCFQGFLCGVASALCSLDIQNMCTLKLLSEMKPCIETCTDLIDSLLQLFFLEGDNVIKDEPDNFSLKDGRFESLLSDIDLEQKQHLRKSLLHGLFKGENLEAAFCLKQIFRASSAILNFMLRIKSTSVPSRLLPVLIRVSQDLLSEFVNHSGTLEWFSFVWLGGVVEFSGELGKIFLERPSAQERHNSLSSTDLFVKQIELHLKAIGKCVSLQGKEATLASREIESSTKMLSGGAELDDLSISRWLNHLDELKSGLRTSFATYIGRASDSHLLATIQAIERALVCNINYKVTTGSSDGGKVSASVSGGIDCLDLILEHSHLFSVIEAIERALLGPCNINYEVTVGSSDGGKVSAGIDRSDLILDHATGGKKKLARINSRIQGLVLSLLNIVAGLQGPNIFFRNFSFRKDFTEPDPGSVCLMCISVLTKISAKYTPKTSAKHAFRLEGCHIGQLLHMPAAIFQSVFQLCSRGLISGEIEDCGSRKSCVMDRQFCLKLYAACCRLLCTVLKHYRSETRCCIALLEDSVGKLLNCLEMVCTNPAGGGYFGWEVQEGVRCASFLRRVYEEIRQQKDVYGYHCSQFLSSYIWVYCGGRLKNGIIREIDEALRPGVYALIDVCSADDLQHLHTVFGEGPCRSTLASLQHDYKLHFQYEGKV